MTIALALGFLGRNWRLALAVVAALAAVALLAWTRHQGVIAERDRWEKRAAAAEKKAGELTDALSRKAQTAGEQASASQVQVRTRTQYVIRSIPNEVPASANPALPFGWLRLYNASLGLPEDAGVAREPADHPAVDAASALETVAGNNGECLADRDQLQRLIALWDQTREQVNGFKP